MQALNTILALAGVSPGDHDTRTRRREQLTGVIAAARADARSPAGPLRVGFTNTTVTVELVVR